MRKAFVLSLTLLAGCAPGPETPASQPSPVIRRVASADEPADTTRLSGVRIELVDAPCQTGDRMPVSRTQPADVPPMPSALPLRELPYIPNVCPVIAAPAQKPATPIHLRGPKAGSKTQQP